MKIYKIVFCETNGSLLSNAIGFFRDDSEIELIPCQTSKDVPLNHEDVHALVIDESFPGVREIICGFREKGARVVLTGTLAAAEDGFSRDYPSDFTLYKP